MAEAGGVGVAVAVAVAGAVSFIVFNASIFYFVLKK